MKLSKLTFIILELNAALDTGNYDGLPMDEAIAHIAAGDVVSWLKQALPCADFGLLTEDDTREYQSALAEIYGGYGGRERRKWGVQNRALCLLIAWTNELIQRRACHEQGDLQLCSDGFRFPCRK